jgi:Transglutaminase-like superfamily/Coenzyme PQQ synthesis protein D (PqqD)
VVVCGFIAGAHIRYRQIDGCGVILDIANQRYSVLDETGTAMWTCLTGEADAAMRVQQWAREFDVPAEQIVAAFDEFAASCLKKGFLHEGKGAESRQVACQGAAPPKLLRHLPKFVLAFLALTHTAASLKFRGFNKTYRQWPETRALKPPSASASGAEILRPFLLAENVFFFGRAPHDCLVRSLALFRFLRWRGIPAVHVIGVRRVPFLAHAWVEVAGEGVLAPRPRGFSALATLPH